MEASLAFFCPRDGDQLDSYWRGEMSPRRLLLLLDNLPNTSPLKEAWMGKEEALWNPDRRLLASIYENIDRLVWVTGLVNSDKFKHNKNPIPEPEPIPRPGVESKKERTKRRGGVVFGGKNPSSREDLERFFGKPSPKRE